MSGGTPDPVTLGVEVECIECGAPVCAHQEAVTRRLEARVRELTEERDENRRHPLYITDGDTVKRVPEATTTEALEAAAQAERRRIVEALRGTGLTWCEDAIAVIEQPPTESEERPTVHVMLTDELVERCAAAVSECGGYDPGEPETIARAVLRAAGFHESEER